MDYFRWQAWICVIAAVITLFLLANLSAQPRRARVPCSARRRDRGIARRAVRCARVQILAFVVSAGMRRTGGRPVRILSLTVLGPTCSRLTLSLSLLAGAVFGGLGTLSGAVYGVDHHHVAAAAGPTTSQSLSLSDNVQNNLPQAVYGVGLILGMLLFPLGISAAWSGRIGAVDS